MKLFFKEQVELNSEPMATYYTQLSFWNLNLIYDPS